MANIKINSEIDEVQRKQSAVTVRDVLRFITPEEDYIFDNYDNASAYSSDLSDPFSDFDGAKLYQEQKRKRLSKLDADIQLMSSFSKDFLKVQEELRSTMMLGPNICNEDLLSIRPRQKEFIENEEITKYAEEVLGFCGLDAYVPEKKIDTRARDARLKSKKSSSPMPPVEIAIETNSQSAVWRMLEAKSDKDKEFPISPMGYNIYEDKKHDWLKRNDLSWDDKENLKKKCEDWLKTID